MAMEAETVDAEVAVAVSEDEVGSAAVVEAVVLVAEVMTVVKMVTIQ